MKRDVKREALKREPLKREPLKREAPGDPVLTF